jgi:hypothetical protein
VFEDRRDAAEADEDGGRGDENIIGIFKDKEVRV